MKTFMTLIVMSLSMSIFSQTSEHALFHAAASKGAQEFFFKNSSLRTGGYMYVAGASLNNAGDYDMLLTKYQGTTEIWSVSWNGNAGGDDYAAGVATDSGGNVFIVGTSYVGNTVNYDGIVVKYNSSGVLQWSSIYSNPNNLPDGFVSVATDASGSVYVCGGTTSTTELTNFLTAKYASNGTLLWDSEYDYNNLDDLAVKLVVGGSSVRISGGSQNTSADWKMSTVSYNANTGAQMAAQQTGGDNDGIDLVTDAWTDGTYTYVTGAVSNAGGLDWKIIKLDDDLSVIWSDTYDGADGLDDSANSLALDTQGNVYVTGYTSTIANGKDCLTRKYNSSGSLLWSSTLSNPDDDEAVSIELDANQHVVIAGSSYRISNLDYSVVKYKGTDGSQVWSSYYNSEFNDDDIPSNIAIDDSGNIFVIGTIGLGDGTTTYLLCKYVVKTLYMPTNPDGYPSNGGYVPNNEQLRNMDGTTNTSVAYYNQSHTPSTYVDDNKISYLYSNITEDTLANDTLHRIDMKFNKGIYNAKVYAVDERSDYINFYLGHMSKKSERTQKHNSLVKAGVYTNTDVIFTHGSGSCTHWIIARQGAPTSDFELQYDGQSSLSIDSNGDLVLGTSIGDYIQARPKAYSLNEVTGELTEHSWQPDYAITGGNKVNFQNFGQWTGVLVIELVQSVTVGASVVDNFELDWSTFFGGDGFDRLHDIEGRDDGACWATGYSYSLQYPLVAGASTILTTGGGTDLVLASFSNSCTLNWVAFYGGSSDDRGNGVELTDDGNIVVVGWSQSTDFPNYAGGALNNSVLNGFTDACIIRFNPFGFPNLDHLFGGDQNDWAEDVVFREEGATQDLFIVGHSKSSTSSFPPVGGGNAYVQGYAGTDPSSFVGDGFIMRINEQNDQVIWRSFFGSDEPDKLIHVEVAGDDVFVLGLTESTGYSSTDCGEPSDGGLPHCIPTGSYENTDFTGGGYEVHAFVARFDTDDNSLQWSTLLFPKGNSLSGGSGLAHNLGIGSQGPQASDLYICSTVSQYTEDYFDFITSASANSWNQDENFVNTAAYLMRFRIDQNLNTLSWATGVDGNDYQMGEDVVVDASGNVHLVGHAETGDIQDELDWCTIPDNDGFPMCNLSGNNYLEENELPGVGWYRATISSFNSSDQIQWSTFLGNTPYNRPTRSAVVGDYFFICGIAFTPQTADPNWTLWQFDINSDLDYFQPFHAGGDADGVISRFHKSIIVGVENEQPDEVGELILYPNPTEDILQVSIPSDNQSSFNLTVTDVLGRPVIIEKEISNNIIVDVSNLPAGQYIVSVRSESDTWTSPFIKK